MNKFFPIFLLIFLAFAGNASAQKIADYKISNIKVVPFEQSSGEFEPEITDTDDRAFFNELGKGLFVTIEISGKAGDYLGTRGLSVTVLEGKKVKMKKVLMSGILNEQGKYYFPIWIEPALCDGITITASLTGQKTPSKTTKTLPFMCGE